MPSTAEVDAVLGELDQPAVQQLAQLRADVGAALATLNSVAEQAQRLIRLIDTATLDETDPNVLSVLRSMSQKLDRAMRDANDARGKVGRAGDALREAQALGRALYDLSDQTPPAHLESVPGKRMEHEPE